MKVIWQGFQEFLHSHCKRSSNMNDAWAKFLKAGQMWPLATSTNLENLFAGIYLRFHAFICKQIFLFDLKKIFCSSWKIIQSCFLWECFLTCTDIYCKSDFWDLFFWICYLCFAFLFLEHSCLWVWTQEEICRVGNLQSITNWLCKIHPGNFSF